MEKTFEASLDELEKIVSQLEDGVKLSRECKDRLMKAERRIEILMKDADGSPSLQELEPDSLRAEKKSSSGKRIVFEDNDEPF